MTDAKRERKHAPIGCPLCGGGGELIKFDHLFPLMWVLNDHLRLTPDGGVEYAGSQNDVLDFREALHAVDPHFTKGLEP